MGCLLMNATKVLNFATEDCPTLYIMCGVPASGKSTWAKKFCNSLISSGYKAIIISRDEIRFGMLEDTDEYFAKENKVFEEYCRQIQEYIDKGYQVIADATQITAASRSKLLNHLEINKGVLVYCVNIDMPLNTCIEMDRQREGRRGVGSAVIRRMTEQKTHPSLNEYSGFKYDGIIDVHVTEGEI